MAQILIIRYQTFEDGAAIVGAGEYSRKEDFFEYIRNINGLYERNNTFSQRHQSLKSAAIELGRMQTHAKIPIFTSFAEFDYNIIKGNGQIKELTSKEKADELEMRIKNELRKLAGAQCHEGLLIISKKGELQPAANPLLYSADGKVFNEDRFLDASFEEVKRMRP